MLTVESLSAGYGQADVIRDVTFQVSAGTTLILTGDNGSGKSTCLKAIFGSAEIRRSSGTTLWNGSDTTVSRDLILIPQLLDGFPSLTVKENIDVMREARQIPINISNATIFETFPTLRGLAGERVGNLSTGESRQLSLIRAQYSKANLLLIDEPTAGLSASAVASLVRGITFLKSKGKTMVIIDHNPEFAAAVGDSTLSFAEGGLQLEISH